MISTTPNDLSERLFGIGSSEDFLSLTGQANEVPIYIQPYEPAVEDAARRMAGKDYTYLLNHLADFEEHSITLRSPRY